MIDECPYPRKVSPKTFNRKLLPDANEPSTRRPHEDEVCNKYDVKGTVIDRRKALSQMPSELMEDSKSIILGCTSVDSSWFSVQNRTGIDDLLSKNNYEQLS